MLVAGKAITGLCETWGSVYPSTLSTELLW